MSQVAINVRGISKQYRIGGQTAGYETLRERLSRIGRHPLQSLRRTRRPAEENMFWALRDVSFQVNRGEVVGIVGRNGAGKSTMLKVLSRITTPTEGSAEIHGRVGSLLEVGTGFHPELTGRENIFLNGAILGMRRAEISRQFDDIVSFSEVEKFIDTPIKHYSTGMYLRLAFSVAAHLQTEILLVDEVLAVGDVAFQRKCLGKMGDVARQGRTVLFVSHNMAAVRALCEKGVVLDKGRVVKYSPIGESIETYYRLAEQSRREEEAGESSQRTRLGFVRLVGREGSTIQQSEPFEVATSLHLESEVAGFSLLCLLVDAQQRTVFHLRRDSPELGDWSQWQGRYDVNLRIPPLWLEPGVYNLYFKALLWNNSAGMSRLVSDILHLDVGGEACGWGSVLSPHCEWQAEPGKQDIAVEVKATEEKTV